ncbi:M12 family metallo-peptidase [Aeromonas schubertii]|uniref:M12 family metallo-peptidase n=1 Tax=Aeromonas schubertii TaxID=652 RepID=A0ABS7V6S6_9GAMM|nr:zinc-dependent metalloprotease family protein [Aeromonas schubertii]MBZ6064771.1 M12 family metallo-peptidase [Aeromonas schubertii]
MQKTMTALLVGALLGSGSAVAVTVDLMVLHTPGVAKLYNGDAGTRAQHLVNVANQVYANSGLDVTLRLVHNQQVTYPDLGSDEVALDALTGRTHKGFKEVSALRTRYGADVVTLLRPEDPAYKGSCGLGWVGGSYTSGRTEGKMASFKESMYSHVVVQGCPDITLVHELGHNMGLNHSWLQDGEGGGTFSHALGHGEQGIFSTVMAYPHKFGVRNSEYTFSSPALTCKGRPCGVPIGQPNEADAVAALRVTIPQVAAFYPTMIAESAPDLVALEAEVTRLRQALADEQKVYQSAREAFDAKEQRYQQLKDGYNGKQAGLQQARQQLNDAIRASNALVNESNALVDRINRARDRATRAALIKQYEALQPRLNEAQRLTQERSTGFNVLVAQFNGEVEEFNQLARNRNQERQKMDVLETRLEQARNALNLAETRFQLAQAKAGEKATA